MELQSASLSWCNVHFISIGRLSCLYQSLVLNLQARQPAMPDVFHRAASFIHSFIICNTFWSWPSGDHGDPDLQIALDRAASAGKPVALAVFGHMHHTLRAATGNCIRRRNMVHIDADTSTVFINCAVVPRWGVSHNAQSDGDLGSLHHFTVVNIAAAGYVDSASHVWVDVNDSQYPVVQHEDIVWTNSYKDGKLHRTCLNTGGASVSATPSNGSLPCHHSVVSSY